MSEPEKDKQQLIFDSAEQIFGASGYASATIEEIAGNAGVAKGTVYLYFSSKQELFISLLENRIGNYQGLIETRLRTGGTVQEVLNALIATRVQFVQNHLGLIDAMFQSMVSCAPEMRDRVLGAKIGVETLGGQSLAAFLPNHSEEQARQLVVMVGGMVDALVADGFQQERDLNDQSIADQVISLVLPGILAY